MGYESEVSVGEFIAFVKRHWKAYLVGAIVALTLGFAAAYFVYSIGTTFDAPEAEAALLVGMMGF